MRELKLGKDGKYVALVDDEDYDRLIAVAESMKGKKRNYDKNWSYAKRDHTMYGILKYRDENKKHKSIYMHRVVMRVDHLSHKVVEVDHKNHYGLDNQKDNLRLAYNGENWLNRTHNKNGTSKYVGVSFRVCIEKKKWNSMISSKNLGTFFTEEEAAIAYNNAAKERFGEWANLNILPDNYLDIIAEKTAKLKKQLENKENRFGHSTTCEKKYYGVFKTEIDGNIKYKVVITNNGEELVIGFFDDEKVAARAWDAKSKEIHGEFALRNFAK